MNLIAKIITPYSKTKTKTQCCNFNNIRSIDVRKRELSKNQTERNEKEKEKWNLPIRSRR